MKIFRKQVQKMTVALAGGPVAKLIRVVGATGRVKFDGMENVRTKKLSKPVIFAFWHEHIINITAFLGTRLPNQGLTILIGNHSDAEIIARVCGGIGIDTVRGSKTRGGAAALEGILRVLGEGKCVVFTPDGPRGPRRQAKEGVIVAAQRSGIPIVPITAIARPSLHAGSWDRMEIPLPFASVRAVEGENIFVPPGADAEERERCRARLQQELNTIAEKGAGR